MVGGGGREHALCWKLSIAPSVRKVFCVPGNPGTAQCAENLPHADFDGISDYCRELGIDLVVIGPEGPLIAGLADHLRGQGVAVFGPSAAAAEVEGSKAFSKRLMREHDIPTASFESFTDAAKARAYAEAQYAAGRKLVVKADGEAFGKGAVVTSTLEEALAAIHEMMVDRAFGEAGETVVIEERLSGAEVSIFSLRGEGGGVLLPPIQDYKRACDGDEGPNTGGMGARTLVGEIDDGTLRDWGKEFCDAAAVALAAEGRLFVGSLFAGLIRTADGPKCLEYNCRFGDPETQTLVRLDDRDWGSLLYALAIGNAPPSPDMLSQSHCIAITLASGGYPGMYEKGKPISGLEHCAMLDDVIIFHAGTAMQDGRLVTAAGRVLTVSATGSSLAHARSRAYEAVRLISFEGMNYRRDIGLFPTT